ncbi:PTS sugar transporter subunit IIB [Enterococcus hulanensis]|uniref:PTS sugar transporter subunit IIB n=1 Tax=Enterococcus hulanensis TaxID=2559929 RepID=UPI001A8D2A47|nr:PTS sugar transporter subunit IIB [Enterococcus hulanensis]MBO0455839.1 PTS sugar transporter subunit IIB [Enterococcus hulanensis]
MGKVSFARVDERLIHGQVVVSVAASSGANTIYIVDDELAKDDFMQTILAGSARKANMTFKAFSVEGIIDQWEKDQFGDDKVLLISKTVPPMIEVAQRGVEMESINLGNVMKKKDSVQIINTAAIRKEEAEDLKKLNEEKNINVYFQTIPGSTGSVSLKEALKKFN